MDIIQKELEEFAKRDLAIRKAIAERQEQLQSRHRTLRFIEQRPPLNQDSKGKRPSGADTGGVKTV